MSRHSRDAASSDTNVRNTSAERGPTGSDDTIGPPNTRRTTCRAHHGVPVMRPLTLLPLDPTNATARGACAERSEMGQPVCGSLAVTPQLRGSSGCRVRAPAPPAVGRSRSGSCDCIPVTAAYRGLVIGGRASACRVPDNDIPTAVTDRDPHVMSRRWRLFALGFHGTARWDRHGPPGSRAVDG